MTARVLAVAEHDGQRLTAATARMISCAASIPDAEVTLAVFAAGVAADAMAAEAAMLDPVDRVLLIRDDAHAHPLAEIIAPQLAALGRDFTHVLAPASTFGKDLLPRVAALLGVAQISDVIEVLAANRFRRPIYAGNAIATVEVLTQPVVATVRVSVYTEAQSRTAAAPIEAQKVAAGPTRTRFESLSGGQTGRPDLQSARRVVTGGRGMGSADGFRRTEQLADALGAAVGATRAAVDAGYAPNELQVGQTGKVIAPELYIALGVSGAIQHLAGIKDAGTVVAINKDSEAPIFEFADIGLVANVDDVLPELQALLAARPA